jgi:hypothetical protein
VAAGDADYKLHPAAHSGAHESPRDSREITDRVEGRAKQAVDVNIETPPNLNLRVVFVDSDGDGRPAKPKKR